MNKIKLTNAINRLTDICEEREWDDCPQLYIR